MPAVFFYVSMAILNVCRRPSLPCRVFAIIIWRVAAICVQVFSSCGSSKYPVSLILDLNSSALTV